MSADLHALARALGGEVAKWRGGVCCKVPGIGHSAADRSVSVLLGPFPDGFWITCFGSGNPLAERERVLAVLAGQTLTPPTGPASRGGSSKLRKPDPNALWMFDEARHPAGTRVEQYLAHRGLGMPAGAAGAAIRYDPHHPFDGERVPAMLGLVRDLVSNAPQAIHRTAISWGGTSYDVHGKSRLALGPLTGGAVKLTPQEAVGSVLGVGEGIETTLSLRLVEDFGEQPVWALLNAAGLASLPPLPGIKTLWIAVDNDEAGRSAAKTCSGRWRRAGRSVVLITPTAAGLDLNDLTRGRHADA